MVGLCIANQLIERHMASSITVLDKEPELGLHSSGRNSGVLHAGLYYSPESLKAKVCVTGAKRLRAWIEDRCLSINPCGKVIVPQKEDLDLQLDLLARRGKANGAEVEFWDAAKLHEVIPEARSASGRALWSPNTAVVKPLQVIQELEDFCLVQHLAELLLTVKDYNTKMVIAIYWQEQYQIVDLMIHVFLMSLKQL